MTAAPPDRGSRGPARRRALLGLCGLLAIVVFSLTSPYFLSVDNLVNLLSDLALAGILAMPATFLIMSGQVDLSVGAAAALTGVVVAGTAPQLGVAPAVLLATGTGLLIGLVNGLLVTTGGVDSIAATFATMAVTCRIKWRVLVELNGGF